MDEEELFKKSIQGSAIVFGVTILSFIVGFASQVILVRLLAPEFFGMIAFALVITGFLGFFGSINSSANIIQRKDRIEEAINVGFTLELILTIVLTIIVVILAPFIMAELGKPHLTTVVQLFAFLFLLNPIRVPGAIFSRDLDFKMANIPNVVGVLTNAIISVSFAVLGFGLWSLIYGRITSTIASSIVLWKIIPYKPKFEFDMQITKEIFNFGMPLMMTGIIAFFYWNVDDFMVGKMLGDEQLGYYWLAFYMPHFLMQIRNSLSTVVFPAFSRVKSDDALKKGFTLLTKYTAIIMLLPCAIVLSLGEPTIIYIFGEKWLPVVVPFQIFMVLVAIRGITGYWTDVYMSKGKTLPALKLTAINAVILVPLGYYLLRWNGITGMAIAVLVTIAITVLVAMHLLKKVINVNYTRILWKNIMVFVFTIILANVLAMYLSMTLINYLIILIIISSLYLLILYGIEREELEGIKALIVKSIKGD